MPLVRFIARNLARGVVTTLVVLLVFGGFETAAPSETSGLVSVQSFVGKLFDSHTLDDLTMAEPEPAPEPGPEPEPDWGPNFIGIVAGRLVRTDDTGAVIASITGTGHPKLDRYVEELIVDVTGTGDDALRLAYDHIRAVPYQTMSHIYDPDWHTWAPGIALQLFELNEANCYRYAAAMTYVAIGLGYDAQVRIGYASHKLAEHAWCEVTLPDGEVRVIDCSLGNDHAYPDLDWCMVPYEDAGVWYFDLDYQMYEGTPATQTPLAP